MVHELHEKKKMELEMDEEEKNAYDAEKALVRQFFRNDSDTIN
jgi:hypothetical protein